MSHWEQIEERLLVSKWKLVSSKNNSPLSPTNYYAFEKKKPLSHSSLRSLYWSVLVFYLVNTQYVFVVVSDDNHDNSTCSTQYGTSKKANLDNL